MTPDASLPPALRAALGAPSPEFSPVSIWWWSGERLTRERLRWQLERFVAGGVHQLVILNLAPSGPMFGADADDPPFFSPAWWELLAGVCEDAERLGVRLWIYDQLGFSGADLQARLVDERPAFAGRWLARERRVVAGGERVRWPDGSWPLAATARSPEGGPSVRLAVGDGALAAPGQGPVEISMYFATARGFDYLAADACAVLLDRVHGEYERRLGHRLGGVVAGSFQDELPGLPTWTVGFARAFAGDHGYDLLDRLEALWEVDDIGGEPVRQAFHATRARLAEAAFFRPLAAWHERHGMLIGCDQQDPARAGHPIAGVQLYADYARTHRWFSAPGSDHHGDARIHASLAHLHDRPRVWIEAFHSSGWGGTLEETLDWLLPWLRAGATLYNPHAVYATTKAGWWEWAPPSTDWRQPYWHHHRVFADALARMSAALSLGRHVCDVAVLLPTVAAQAATGVAAVGAVAAAAQDAYLELVGDMSWFHTRPGMLDRLGLDADVVDDGSIARAELGDGRLRVAGEAYAAVIVPACRVLAGETARRLTALAAAGGRVVLFGDVPQRGVGDPDAGAAVQALRAAVDGGAVRVATSEAELAAALAGLGPARAPTRPLVREVDGVRVVLVTAADPRASEVAVAAPDARGADLGWLDASIDFDAGRYRRSVPVIVAGDHDSALRVGPFGAAPRVLRGRQVDGGTEFDVPFDDGPLALLVLSAPAGDDAASHDPGGPPTGGCELAGPWEVDVAPTLDNTWGDFAAPAGAAVGAQRWAVRHRREEPGDDGVRDGWATAELGDGDWEAGHATFGARALWTGPAAPDALPAPGAGPGAGWRPAVWSSARGRFKDPIHRETLGPKGHVPEEFLDFGPLAAGQAVHLRADVVPADAGPATLAIGAAAVKEAWLDGRPLALDDRGHLALSGQPVALSGRHRLDVRLTADQDGALRAWVALVADAERAVRPEWITADGADGAEAASEDVTLSTRFTLAAPASGAVVQVALQGRGRVELDGDLLGIQGGFDPYDEQPVPRTRRYALDGELAAGEHELAVTVTAGACVLVDGRFGPATVLSGPGGWRAHSGGAPVALQIRRRPFGDPAALHLWRRPHPLADVAWLEGQPGEAVADLQLPVDPAPIWLRFTVPPGARTVEADVHGAATLYLDGVAVGECAAPASAAPCALRAVLDDGAGAPPRVAALRVAPRPAYGGGAVLAGPIRFALGPGRMALGDWEAVGLPEHAGGVRYRAAIPADAPVAGARRLVLDLGAVRGTAEVTVGGRSAGVRICAPWTFDLSGLDTAPGSTVEIAVFGTLAPYLDAVSPTHFVFAGQRTAGLMGPVTLRWWTGATT